MKIAVLFYGRIKNYDKNYDSLINAVGEADFFLSHSPELNENLDDFIELYKPKKVLNDPITIDRELLKYPHYNRLYARDDIAERRLSALINIERVFNSFEEFGESYDYIIVTRVDLLYRSKYNFSNMNLCDKTIYIPSCYDHGPGINDQIAVGNINAIREYCELNKNYKNLLDLGNKHGGEIMMKAHLENKNLKVKRFSLDYEINRS